MTRARIIDVARRLILAGGYQAMTISALADEAGVSNQTVYNAVGTKPEVVKALYDVTLAGDDDPRPMSERPAFQAMAAAPDAASLLRAYAAAGRLLSERVGPLLATLLASAAADDDLRAFAETIDGERLRGNGMVVARLVEQFGLPVGWTAERAVDVLWVLTSPDTCDRLVRRRGWSYDEYEAWLGNAMVSALAPSSSASGV